MMSYLNPRGRSSDPKRKAPRKPSQRLLQIAAQFYAPVRAPSVGKYSDPASSIREATADVPVIDEVPAIDTDKAAR